MDGMVGITVPYMVQAVWTLMKNITPFRTMARTRVRAVLRQVLGKRFFVFQSPDHFPLTELINRGAICNTYCILLFASPCIVYWYTSGLALQ